MAKSTISINNEQRLFVIPCGGGFSCLGFDNCYRDAVAMAQMMKVEPPDALSIGTMACYNAYLELGSAFSKHAASKQTWFTPGTPEQVRRILNRAIVSYQESGRAGQLLRIFTGDTLTGRDSCEEWDTVGFIGRSAGYKKTPLLLEPLVDFDGSIKCANDGSGLLTDRILRIIEVNSRKELYRAANYQLPEFTIAKSGSEMELPFMVARDGQGQARFVSHGEACEYIAFMTGALPAKGFQTVQEFESSFAD